MKVHEKIRAIRQSKNWSQDVMAEKLGMTSSGYAKIEQGRTDNHFSKLEQIAEIFDMDVVEFLAFGEKNVFFLMGDNSIGNSSISMSVIGSSKELAFEIQKQQLIIELKDKELAMQQREIALKDKEISHLEKLLEMHKNSKPNLTRSQRLRWERLMRSSASGIVKRSLRVGIPKLELGNELNNSLNCVVSITVSERHDNAPLAQKCAFHRLPSRFA